MNENGKLPGQGAATGSMILGIIGLVVGLFLSGPVGMIIGIVGLIMASKAKKEGFVGGMRTAGFVMSLIAVIIGAVMLIACIACAGTIGILSAMG